MRDFKGMKRQRGRNRGGGNVSGGSGGKPQQNANRAFDSNGPDNIKVRGHAQHVFEKYQQLARDATTSGDRVLAENFLQHAEHYFRVLRTIQPNRPISDFVARDSFASGYDIDFEDESGAQALPDETPPEAQSEGQGQGQGQNEGGEQRGDYQQRDNRNDRPRQDGQFRQDGQSRQDNQPRQDGQSRNDGQQRNDGQNRNRDRYDRDRPRDDRPRDDNGYRAEGDNGGQRDDRNGGYRDRDRNYQNDRPRDDRPRNDGQQRNDQSRNDQPREDRAARSDQSREDRPREERTREDRPRRERTYEPRADRADPLAVVEPQAAPLTPERSDAEAPSSARAPRKSADQGAGVLRSHDGETSHAPAFLQAAPAPAASSEEAPVKRPRGRPRKVKPEATEEA